MDVKWRWFEFTVVKSIGTNVYGFSRESIGEEAAHVKRADKGREIEASSSDYVGKNEGVRYTIARIN